MAIDQGTTGTKVILVDHDGMVVSSAYREIKQIYPEPGWVEHDPLEYWETTLICAKEALDKARIKPSQIAGIGITDQRETTIIWDKKTGEPVYNAIVWQCRRSASICEDLKAKGLEEKIRQKTGLTIDAYFSATKIKWIMENVPGVKERMKKGELIMGNIDSWLMWKLSGGQMHVTDYSNASRTMLFNVQELNWDQELLDIMEIPREIFPNPKPSSGIMAISDKSIFNGAEIPIAGVAGDQHAALFGQACFKPGMAKNTYGTALALMMNIGEKFILSEHGLTTDLAWGIDGKIEYSFEGVVFIGGAAIQWLRDGLGIIESAAQSEAIAQSVKDTGDVYFVPAFTGLCAPYWDMYARGTIVGITRGTTKEQIVRSALESMAYQTRDVLEAMITDSKRNLNSLRVDGGAVKNNFLMQFQADILGVPVIRPVVTEMAALGAAYLAGLGVGFWKNRDEISAMWKMDRVFEPKMDVGQREELYRGWKKAVERSLHWAE
ncbi:MAG: glycerol kinase GlpK [Candidatus Atribacteria bacterium]|nr:glycerol kinase GlpK [Candidatus Atribacteria bacterium]